MSVAMILTAKGGAIVLNDAHLVGMDHIAHASGVYEICDGDKIRFQAGLDDVSPNQLKLV